MDNDSANLQVLIPPDTLVDLRIGGTIEQFFWALSVQNLFDVRYFEYAISAIDFFTGLPSSARTAPIRCPDGPSWRRRA